MKTLWTRPLAAEKGKTVDAIIPAYHPGEKFYALLDRLCRQSYPLQKIIVIHTEDKDGDALEKACQDYGKKVELYHIQKAQFDHGASRNLGVSHSHAEYFLMMTDDAVPRDRNMLEYLLAAMETDKRIGSAYARQVCGQDSGFDERLARAFNYPGQSFVKGQADLPELGIKTYFQSNACCLYRRSIFDELQGFISHTIFNEDMIYCHKMLAAGYLSAYVAEAAVVHSHHYSGSMQFRRNFDLGVSHADHPEVFADLASEGEGIKMVRQGLWQLARRGQAGELPRFLWISGCKWLGYRLGRSYRALPPSLVQRTSMNQNYWKKED